MGSEMKTEGAYCGTVIKQAIETTEKGTASVVLYVKLSRRENDYGEIEECNPAFVRPINLWLTPGAMDSTIRSLTHLGFRDSDLRQLLPGVEGHFSFVGQEVWLTCRHGEYRDKPREEWNLQRRRREVTEIDSDVLADTFALFASEREAASGSEDHFAGSRF